MTAFERALSFTLRCEGGYTNHSEDPGGATNWGISQRAYPDLDIRALTREQAAELYHRDYWLAAGCDELPGPIAIAVFDCAVHSGISRSLKLLQELVGAVPDGVLGAGTIASLNSFCAGRGYESTAEQLVIARLRFLVRLEKSKGRWTFIEGFAARCAALAAYVVVR